MRISQNNSRIAVHHFVATCIDFSNRHIRILEREHVEGTHAHVFALARSALLCIDRIPPALCKVIDDHFGICEYIALADARICRRLTKCHRAYCCNLLFGHERSCEVVVRERKHSTHSCAAVACIQPQSYSEKIRFTIIICKYRAKLSSHANYLHKKITHKNIAFIIYITKTMPNHIHTEIIFQKKCALFSPRKRGRPAFFLLRAR